MELFPLGRTVIARTANEVLDPGDVQRCLDRHAHGDWGELDEHDRSANQAALAEGLRLLSVYHDRAGTKFYIVTEADRSITTVMLPEDY